MPESFSAESSHSPPSLPLSQCSPLFSVLPSSPSHPRSLSPLPLPSLTVKTSTSSVDVDRLEDLKVTTTITNTGDVTLKLLNDPRGALSSFPGKTFTVTDANGSLVRRSTAIFLSVSPPRSDTSNLFIYVDADGTLRSLSATVRYVAGVELFRTLAVTRVKMMRAPFNGCSADKQSQINDAGAGAHTHASDAYSYLSGISSGIPRFTTWFGTYIAYSKIDVQNHFKPISSNDFSSFTFDCTCTESASFAYVRAYIFHYGIIIWVLSGWKMRRSGEVAVVCSSSSFIQTDKVPSPTPLRVFIHAVWDLAMGANVSNLRNLFS